MPGNDTASDPNEQMPLGGQLTLSKIDVARRQLATGIELWFKNGDPVSIHALVYAAYEIVHVVSKKRGRKVSLILDTDMIKDEYREDWGKVVKKHSNFFKHADRDADAEISFNPVLSEYYILFCLRGLDAVGIQLSDIESAFFWWNVFSKPKLLTDRGREMLADCVGAEHPTLTANFSKADFFEQFLKGRQALRSAGKIS